MSSSVSSPSKTFIFCAPQQGKPNPKEPISEHRSQVIQRGLSNKYLGWYSAFNWIRPRLNASDGQDHPQRKIESIISNLRKQITNHQRIFAGHAADPVSNTPVQIVTKDRIQGIKQEISKLSREECFQIINQQMSSLSGNEVSKLASCLRDLASGKDLEKRADFIDDTASIEENKIYQSVLKKFGKPIEQLFQELDQQDPSFFEEWKSYSEEQKRNVINHLVIGYCARLLGIEVSSWHPKQTFQSLIEELNKYGPMVVEGRFGQPLYETPSVKKGTVKEREVYGWDKTAPKVNEVFFHSIVLIGARQDRLQEIIYYIDPADDSDPNHLEKQPIYAMSYDRLTDPAHLCDRLGLFRNDASKIGYAYRRGSFLNKEIIKVINLFI